MLCSAICLILKVLKFKQAFTLQATFVAFENLRKQHDLCWDFKHSDPAAAIYTDRNPAVLQLLTAWSSLDQPLKAWRNKWENPLSFYLCTELNAFKCSPDCSLSNCNTCTNILHPIPRQKKKGRAQPLPPASWGTHEPTIFMWCVWNFCSWNAFPDYCLSACSG